MAKVKSVYICSDCGAESPKWVGKCPSCGAWNTYVEELVKKEPAAWRSVPGIVHEGMKPRLLRDVTAKEETRIDMHDAELNRVLGGGLVKGSLVLVGGEPGIGKSTLVLQTVLQMKDLHTLYVSGEESAQQLKMRADRLAGKDTNMGNCHVYCETNLEQVFVQAQNLQPDLLIIDSIQTIFTDRAESSPGSITQVRECSAAVLKFAKETGTPVDTVLQFEGDQHYMYRILRSIKNRFGSTSELGIYEMRQSGLRQVENPSELLLTEGHEGLSGVAIAAAMEGARPFLIETQSLVSSAVYGTPQRSATGFDLRRMNMLLAVLEKRAGFKLVQKDVFLNIAGGLRVSDPAIDLPVISAVLSSSLDIPIDRSTCMAGEVGLSGEIRPVNRIEQRIQEAGKLGFTRMIVPQMKGLEALKSKMKIFQVRKVEEAFRELFG